MKKLTSVLVIFLFASMLFCVSFILKTSTTKNKNTIVTEQTKATPDVTETTSTDALSETFSAEKNEKAENQFPPSYYEISDFPYILQLPELPTGCEITALTMVLNYYGFDIDKLTMAVDYLPTSAANIYYDENGAAHGEDLNDYFIGDPQSVYGYVCGTNAIVTAADSYLDDADSFMTATDISGSTCDELYELTANDTPVVVWVTIGMQQRSETEGWYTDSGDYVEWSQSDHAAVLVGYTDDTVIIADPLSGRTEYSKSAFESSYTSRGSHAVIIE